MEKKLIREYTFDASAKTITAAEFTSLRKIALITNVTTGDVIYDALDATLGATRSGTTITLDFDTTAMSDTDELQILVRIINGIDRIGFAKAISNNVDTDFLTLRQTGSGQTVNQTGGNLVLTTGTTARAETIIRSNMAYSAGLRFRIQSILSQRIANQQFFAELVDVVGDTLAYTIGSATAITVTLPASFGLSSKNVGQSMTLCGFSGTGTFFSGRYPIASVSGNDATFTVSGFAAGTGTVSAVGWNYYRLEYTGTTATNVLFDTQRNGYASGNTTATINTTASPGHMAIVTGNDAVATLQDQLIASTALIQTTNRATRVVMVPDDAQVFLQIRVVNGTSAPASGTTWTIGQVSIGLFEAESVIVQDMRPTNYSTAIPVELMRGVATATQPVSGTVTSTVANATLTAGTVTGATLGIPLQVVDVASAALTTTTTTGTITPTAGAGYQLFIPVTAVSGTTPSLTIAIEESMDAGTTWFNRVTLAPITATGSYYSPYLKLKGNRVRYVQTVTGTTPSFTRAINRLQGQSDLNEGTAYKLVSAASTNATLVKAGPTTISMLTASNVNASPRYLKLYDLGVAPTVGTSVPTHTFIIPGNASGAGTNIPIPKDLSFTRGFALALTTEATDTGATGVAVSEIVINAQIS